MCFIFLYSSFIFSFLHVGVWGGKPRWRVACIVISGRFQKIFCHWLCFLWYLPLFASKEVIKIWGVRSFGGMYRGLVMSQRGKLSSITSFISAVFASNPWGIWKGNHMIQLVLVGSIVQFPNYWSVHLFSRILIKHILFMSFAHRFNTHRGPVRLKWWKRGACLSFYWSMQFHTTIFTWLLIFTGRFIND